MFPRFPSVGAEFTSLTITVKDFASLNVGIPLSFTRIVIVLVEGPCASVGVHVNTPFDAFTLAPTGAPASKLYASVSLGKSASVAVTVKESVALSSMLRSGTAPRTGAALTGWFAMTLAARGVGEAMKYRLLVLPSGHRPWLMSLVCSPNATLSTFWWLGANRPMYSP